jgi:hypothetical protein
MGKKIGERKIRMQKEERNDCPSSNFMSKVCSHHKQQK